MELTLADEAATTRAARRSRAACRTSRPNLLLGLSGELGSGKTTLARGMLRALGVEGAIRSPTYTLVEPYETTRGTVHHLDLYRLTPARPTLEGLGYRDFRTAGPRHGRVAGARGRRPRHARSRRRDCACRHRAPSFARRHRGKWPGLARCESCRYSKSAAYLAEIVELKMTASLEYPSF